eukprot:TRINITY_DN8836_c0_g1_i2.p1 TRINITY_DN8836_c0_g1~~TRINITY_DN8836_c0_g1_i2.p1  ORF type:complete len:719 (+),score=152.66 TRINITY_DN8836_c0_g1_i2:28-2184(+)
MRFSSVVFFFFFKQKTAYEMLRSLVGSEMCIRDSYGGGAGTSNQTITSVAVDYPIIYVGCADGTIRVLTAWCPWSPTATDANKIGKHPCDHLVDPGALALRAQRSIVSVPSRNGTCSAETAPHLSLCTYAVQRKRREYLHFERRSGVRSDGVVVEATTSSGTTAGGASGSIGGGGGAGSPTGASSSHQSGTASSAVGGNSTAASGSGASAGRQTMAVTMRRGALDYYDDDDTDDTYNNDGNSRSGGGGLAFANFGVLDDNDQDGSPFRKKQPGIRSNGTGGGVGDSDISLGASGGQVLPLGQDTDAPSGATADGGLIDGSGFNPLAPPDYYRQGSTAHTTLLSSPNWEFTVVDILHGGHCGPVIDLSVSGEWGLLVSTSTHSTMTGHGVGSTTTSLASQSASTSGFRSGCGSSYQGTTYNNVGIGLPGSGEFGSKQSILRAVSGSPHTLPAHVAMWDTKRRILVRTLDLSPSSYSSSTSSSPSSSSSTMFLPTRTTINPKGGSVVVFGSEYSLPTSSSSNTSQQHLSLHRQVLRVYTVNGDFMAATVLQGASSDALCGFVPSSSSSTQALLTSPPPSSSQPFNIRKALMGMLSNGNQNNNTSSTTSIATTVALSDHRANRLTWATLCLPPAMVGLSANTPGITRGALSQKHGCFGSDPSPMHSTLGSDNKKHPLPACSIAVALDSDDCIVHPGQTSSSSSTNNNNICLLYTSPSPRDS